MSPVRGTPRVAFSAAGPRPPTPVGVDGVSPSRDEPRPPRGRSAPRHPLAALAPRGDDGASPRSSRRAVHGERHRTDDSSRFSRSYDTAPDPLGPQAWRLTAATASTQARKCGTPAAPRPIGAIRRSSHGAEAGGWPRVSWVEGAEWALYLHGRGSNCCGYLWALGRPSQWCGGTGTSTRRSSRGASNAHPRTCTTRRWKSGRSGRASSWR